MSLTARDIPWRPAPAVWLDPRPIVEAALGALPDIEDDDASALMEHLALAVADREAELRAVRCILSAALTEAQHRSISVLSTPDGAFSMTFALSSTIFAGVKIVLACHLVG